MLSCILELPLRCFDWDLYDPRYFHRKETWHYQTETWHYSCGMARQALMSVYRRHQFKKIQFYQWFDIICESDNPVVQGFLVEQLCLWVIARDGLRAITPLGIDAPDGPIETESFQQVPNWDSLINSTDRTSCLYLPDRFNYVNVDGAILQITSRNPKQAHLYLIQITLAKDHKDSETHFYQNQWWNWVQALEKNCWSVESTFIWIDKKAPEQGVKAKKVQVTHSGEHKLTPDHCYWQSGFQSLDNRFGKLGLE